MAAKSKSQGIATRQIRKQTNGKMSGNSKQFVVEMRELIADVNAATTFSPQQIAINPGLSSTFSWLSQIAGAYEKYRVKNMKFEIMPQCPATTSGGSGMYIDYDANDGVVTSKSDFFAMAGAQVQQIWQEVHLSAVVNNQEYFVRNGSVSDSKLLYDPFTLNYFVESDTTSPNVLIFAHYTVEFLKPQVNMNAAPTSGGALVAYWDTDSSGTSYNVAPTSTSGFTLGTTAGKLQVPVTGMYVITLSGCGDNSGRYFIYNGDFSTHSDSALSPMIMITVSTLTAGVDYTFLQVTSGIIKGTTQPAMVTATLV